MFTNRDYILKVCKEQSISLAAKKLYVSQPSLSSCIKRIEEKVGAPIFDRSTTPISLTEIGKEYVKHANQIDAIESEFQSFINDQTNILKGEIKIGGTTLFSSYLLPQIISKFKLSFPQIKIQISEENTKKLLNALSNGELDIVMDNISNTSDKITQIPYSEEILLLAVPKEFAVSTEKALSFTDVKKGRHARDCSPCVSLDLFKSAPFIFLKKENDTGMREKFLCKKYGFSPKIMFTLDQQITAYNIACSGMGITFVSDTLIKHTTENPDMLYYKLPDPETRRTIYFYIKENRYLSNACRKFLDETLSASR